MNKMCDIRPLEGAGGTTMSELHSGGPVVEENVEKTCRVWCPRCGTLVLEGTKLSAREEGFE